MPASRTSRTTYRNGTTVVTTVYRPRTTTPVAPAPAPAYTTVALRKHHGWSVRCYTSGGYAAVAPSGWVSQTYRTFPGAVGAAGTAVRRHG